jgi:hypothetical protein
MTMTLSERLDTIEREILQQDQAWERTKDGLTRLENVQLAVPRDVLSFLVGPIPGPPAGSVRG